MAVVGEFPSSVVVTGAGRGIGRAVALACGQAGSEVLCLSKTASCVETSEMICAQGGRASAVQADLGDPFAAHGAVAEWAQSHNCLAVVAAAATLGPPGSFLVENIARWQETYRVNVLGNVAVIAAVLPLMRRARFGRIVTFGGGGAAYAYPMFPAYAASKAALVREVENIEEEVKDAGDIAIVCVAPGAIDTDMLAVVQAAGGEVRTKGDVRDVIKFVNAFMVGRARSISGRFVHVRDNWAGLLNGSAAPLPDNHWKLRRIE